MFKSHLVKISLGDWLLITCDHIVRLKQHCYFTLLVVTNNHIVGTEVVFNKTVDSKRDLNSIQCSWRGIVIWSRCLKPILE